ncbi:MAG: MFS transporter, partial [Victivallis vadensis]
MIFKEALSPERQASSQHNYCMFNVINGLSYMCLGETVLILLAVQLGCPDYFISTLGAMLYFGFLLLPLGKIMTARVGAARAQAYFWVARNGAALMVASASVFGYFGMMKTAMALLLIGSFFFYGFRAAGVVMSQPLIGDFTDDRNRARVIAVSVGLFYVSCLIALLTISFVLHLSPSLWTLTGIVVVGACLGFTSSRFLARIDETENIRRSARRPILPELKNILGAVTIRRQIMAGFMVNLGVIMLVPVSMLALKRGYGVSDTDALMFALVQFTACAVMSFLSGKVAAVIGPRKTILIGYILLLSIGVLWLVAPASLNGFYMALPFFFAGGT